MFSEHSPMTFRCVQPDPDTNEDNSDFLKVLEELSGHFHGEERSESPPDHLSAILDTT